MLLSDHSILEALAQGRLVIQPFSPEELQPASVDLHLDDQILTFGPPEPLAPKNEAELLLNEPPPKRLITLTPEKPYALRPREFLLGSTQEHIELASDLVARLEGKSSLGRLGLVIHSTAGFVDPGWQGRLTLELSNLSQQPLALYPGMKIAQISFLELTTPALRPYGHPDLDSKYQGQTLPTASRRPPAAPAPPPKPGP